MRKSLPFAALITLASLSAPALAQNIVNNPNFDTNASGWTLQTFGFYGSTSPSGTGGSVATGCVGNGCVSTYNAGAYIDQLLNTTPGQTYNLSFYVRENSGPTSEFSVFWGGNMIADVLNPANSPIGWVQYSYSNLLASGASTDLQIHGRQDPGGIWFGAISVAPTAGAVPEPATWAMMLVGFAAIGFAMRRKPKSAHAPQLA